MTVSRIVDLCGVCGRGSLKEGAIYRASEGRLPLREFPARECEVCRNMEPDFERIRALPPNDVPSSLRIRCARQYPATDALEEVVAVLASRGVSELKELHPHARPSRGSAAPHR